MTTTTVPSLIAVTGYARSGKDTLARLISKEYGHRVVHFSDSLRTACEAIDPIVGFNENNEPVRWATLLHRLGYEGAKTHNRWGAEFRQVMQRVGSDLGRDLISQDVWVKATFATVTPNESVVIAGGVTVRVLRPGVGPINQHVSETALDGATTDILVINDKEPVAMLRQLERQVRTFRGAA